MAGRLTLLYDREADILWLQTCEPYAAQESQELEDEVVARCHPESGAIEGLEILFFSRRLDSGEAIRLPVVADLHGDG